VQTEPPAAGPPLARPLRADAARNRERILAAAREVFAERGIDATLDDVADRAGVGVGTVYRRFADKDELLDALFSEGLEALVSYAEDAVAADDPWAGLTTYLERGLELHARSRGFREAAFDGRRGGERLAHARSHIAPLVTQVVARAQASGQLRADVATSDIPLIQLMLFGVVESTSTFAPDLWRRYLPIVLDGLRARPGDETPLPAPPLAVEQVAAAMQRSGSRRGRPPGAARQR
jgi:AcrR family transcriptional regulator